MTVMTEAAAAMDHAAMISEQAANAIKDSCCELIEIKIVCPRGGFASCH